MGEVEGGEGGSRGKISQNGCRKTNDEVEPQGPALKPIMNTIDQQARCKDANICTALTANLGETLPSSWSPSGIVFTTWSSHFNIFIN